MNASAKRVPPPADSAPSATSATKADSLLPEAAARPDLTTERGKPKQTPAQVTGVLTVTNRGFGLLLPEGEPSILVPAARMGDAVDGDRVRVALVEGPRGPVGRVMEVLERSTRRFTGVLNDGRILPDDRRLPSPLPVSGDFPFRGPGGLVVATFTPLPAGGPKRAPSATIVERIGPRGSARNELRALLVRDEVPREFPPAACAEAEQARQKLEPDCLHGRVDLRDLELVTIDPEDAQDHDDALFAEPLAGGGTRVVVAIADVAHFVPAGSAMDREAARRGCSIYLPGQVISMLPPVIATELASLVPGEDRPALTVDLVIDDAGEVTSCRVHEAVIRSRARLCYAEVARALAGDASRLALESGQTIGTQSLRCLAAAAARLGSRRALRGAFLLESRETRILVDPATGEPRDAVVTRKGTKERETYRMVEDLMLVANEAIARELAARGVPALYRVHEPPPAERLAEVASLASRLGLPFPDDAGTRPGSLGVYFASLPRDRQGETVATALLRTMATARYDAQNVGHFGLAMERYLHFTSPIRRYPDLVVHRLLRSALRGRPEPLGDLDAIARETSRLERRAAGLEAETKALYETLLLGSRVGEVTTGRVSAVLTGVTEINLDAPAVRVVAAADDPVLAGVEPKEAVAVRITTASIASRTVRVVGISRS